MEDFFCISIHCEHWMPEDKDATHPSSIYIEIDHETIDIEKLKKYVRYYNLTESITLNPETSKNPNINFISTVPRDDEDYKKHKIEKFYRLYIHSINGKIPDLIDFQKTAQNIGVKFTKSVETQKDKHQ